MSKIDAEPRGINPDKLNGRDLTRKQLFAAFGFAGAVALSPTFVRGATAEAADLGDVHGEEFRGKLGIVDLRGAVVVSAPGIPLRVTGDFDLADHPPFRNGWPLEPGHPNPLQNVLGEPGGFLADRDLIANNEPQNLVAWNEKVDRREAEYIVRGGPDANFFSLETRSDFGQSINAQGHWEFNMPLPKHVIVRVDAEEGWLRVRSASRDVLIDLYQASLVPGLQAHHSLFIRTPYEEESLFTADMPTVPGTQVQILGRRVARHIAFASQEAALQGSWQRQGRPAYPRIFYHTANVNDLTFGSVESPASGHLYHHLGDNYL